MQTQIQYNAMCKNIQNCIELSEQINKKIVYIDNGQEYTINKDIINKKNILFHYTYNHKDKKFSTDTEESVDISKVKQKIMNNCCVIHHMFSRYIVRILSDTNQHTEFVDITHRNFRNTNLLSAKIHKQNIDNIKYVYDTLNDDDSKAILCNSINFRLIRNPKVLKTSQYKQYFHPMIYPIENSIIIEGGGFNCNSSLEFLAESKNSATIYCYEPNFNNYLQGFKNIHDKNATGNIFLINNGLSDKNKVLKFSYDAQSSYANENGKNLIFCSSIDALVSKLDIRPTHIKLDIEGEEYNALIGGIDTIKTYKPKLMISSYHKTEDIWNLLKTIQSFRRDYKFSLGFHSNAFTIYEIVLYAY